MPQPQELAATAPCAQLLEAWDNLTAYQAMQANSAMREKMLPHPARTLPPHLRLTKEQADIICILPSWEESRAAWMASPDGGYAAMFGSPAPNVLHW